MVIPLLLGLLALAMALGAGSYFYEQHTGNNSDEEYDARFELIHHSTYPDWHRLGDIYGNMNPLQFVRAVMKATPDFVPNYPVKEGDDRFVQFLSDTADRWLGRQGATTADAH